VNPSRLARAGNARRVARIVAAVLLAATTHAMDSSLPLSRYRHERWDAESGFPGGAVHALGQAADGYLWIGTEKGLVRFDGRDFRIEPGPPEAAAPVLGLAASGDGSLLVRLSAPWMLRHRNGSFETLLSNLDPPETAISAMSPARDGSVLVTTLVNGALRLRERGFDRLAGTGAMPPGLVISMAETPNGTLWLGTRDAGLFTFTEGRSQAIRDGLPDRKVNAILAVSDREVWVGTDQGVARWDGEKLTRKGLPPGLEPVQVLALTKGPDGNLWVGSNTGLHRVNERGVADLENRDERSREPVTALLHDREGILWIGRPWGIERLRSPPITSYTRQDGLPSENIGPVHADAASTWFAPVEGGLFRMTAGHVERVAASEIGDDVVYSIAPGRHGLWLGRQRGGLTHLRLAGGALVPTTFTHADGLAQDGVFAVHEDREGAVWAATLSGGLSRLQGGRFTTHTVADGLPSNEVTSIADTADGTIWVATPKGLGALSKGRWRTLGKEQGLPSAEVNTLHEGVNGVLWVGTRGGLAFARAGSPTFAALEKFREPILGLAEGAGGWLWLATATGVVRVRGESLLLGALREGDIVTYDGADGVRGGEGVKRHRSVVADAQGTVWLSTTRGLSAASPRLARRDSVPAVAHIEGLSVDGKALPLEATVHTPAGPRQITFHYAGVSLGRPDRVRFRYRLDGVDSDWSDPVTARQAVYANLAAGAYAFRVMASNSDGLWNGAAAVVRFEIAPVFWTTAWFRLSLLLALALGGYAFYLARLRQWTRRLNERFEERLAERMRLAHELHDTLLQGVVSASMQLHVAADQMTAESPALPRVRRVQDLMQQVIEEGRNTLRGLRAPEDGDLAAALARVRHEIPGDDPVTLRVLVEGVARPLRPALHDEVYRIGREALRNAFHHAAARNIEVELEYGPHELRMLVRDDGRGIDSQVLASGREGHFGLSGMRERAERIGGRLRLWSGAAAGTEVELSLRNALAFTRSPAKGILTRLGGLRGGGPRPPSEGPPP
jgi:signal transduction histidine kinase/ligand-binding sensor domain-containing protein